MELFANELSLHGQFPNILAFHAALAKLMTLRGVAQEFGQEVHCSRSFSARNAMPDVDVRKAVGELPKDRQRSVMTWLDRGGPFLEELRQHGVDDWLECRGEIVTDSAVGEVAYRSLRGFDCELISVRPSHWDFSPVTVTWRRSEGIDDESIELQNWRDGAALAHRLRAAAAPIRSWGELHVDAVTRFGKLTFSDDSFHPLNGTPFSVGSADRIRVLLDILDRFAGAFGADGKRTSEGQQIYQNYFTGQKALFSDSSETEKSHYHRHLTFQHPGRSGEVLFCPWHGKERHLTLRLHFTWPIHAGEPVYVVYVGPKITRQ